MSPFKSFLFLLSILIIVSCGSSSNSGTTSSGDDFETNSQEISVTNGVFIEFDGEAPLISNPFEEVGINYQDAHVVVTSSSNEFINFVLSGTSTDGSFTITSDNDFGLYFNGADIVNADGPALNIRSTATAAVHLVDKTNNRLTDSTVYTVDDAKGAFHSEGMIKIDGGGTLIVRGKKQHGMANAGLELHNGTVKITESIKDGINTNYVTVTGGTLEINATSDGIDSSGDVRIMGGNISVSTPDGDGIKSKGEIELTTNATVDVFVSGIAAKAVKSSKNVIIENADIIINTIGNAYFDTDDQDTSSSAGFKIGGDFTMNSGSISITSTGSGGKGINVDGITTFNDGYIEITTTGDQFVYGSYDTAAKAVRSQGDLIVNGGTIKIKTHKTEAEGLESKSSLIINDGFIEIEAYDDAINAGTHIQINGGTIYAYSESNDAVDSNGTLTITGGVIVAVGAGSPEAGLDCDNSNFEISGDAIVIGIGGDTSTPTTGSTNHSIIYRSNSATVGTAIRLENSNDEELLTFVIPRAYTNRMTLLVSTGDVKQGQSYTLKTGGSASGGSDFHGYRIGAAFSGGTSDTFTTETTTAYTSHGTTSGGYPGGGGPQRP